VQAFIANFQETQTLDPPSPGMQPFENKTFKQTDLADGWRIGVLMTIAFLHYQNSNRTGYWLFEKG
jgi:hypothetical protein